MKKYVLSAIALLSAAVILYAPAAVGAAVGEAVSSCLEVVVPSLYAFTVLAVYLQRSGLYRTVLRPITCLLSILLGIDKELCAVIILGNIGGYPVGARLLSELVKQGRLGSNEASRLMCCCFGCGPSFVVSVVGLGVFRSAAAGWILFLSCMLTSIIIAFVVCRFGDRITLKRAETLHDLSAECFVSSVKSAGMVMFTVCSSIIVAAVIRTILSEAGVNRLAALLFEHLGFDANADRVFPALLEITGIRNILYSEYAFPLCGVLLSFGGACVLLQVASMTAGVFPLKSFLLSRIPAAILCGAFALIGEILPISAVQTGTFTPCPVQMFSVNAGMSLCVLAMSAILLAGDRLKINYQNPLK